MNYFYFLIVYLTGILFLLPTRLSAKDIQSIEITGKGNNSSSSVFDYQYSKVRNQLCLPPNVLCLPEGTKIHSITLRYRVQKYGSTITESQGNIRIALGETPNKPEYKYPYSYIEDGLETYYNNSDLLEFDKEGTNKNVTYRFDTPYEYTGNYLIVDLLTSTSTPQENAPYIGTTYHQSESITNLQGREENQPYPNSIKPDLILGVELPVNQAVPYIPFTDREQILGHAIVGGSSESLEIPIRNMGDQSFNVTALSGSSAFTLIDPKTVGANSSETIHIQFIPQTAGTYEETMVLQTTAGNFDMKLSGTTYRQTPYSLEITSSRDNPLSKQLGEEKDQITELSISGQLSGYDMYILLNEMPNLTKLDMSAAISVDNYFNMRDENGRRFEQLALPAGIKNITIPQNANLSKLILPLGFESIWGEHIDGNECPLPPNLTTLIILGNNPISTGNPEVTLKYIETVYVPENAVQAWKNNWDWRNKNIQPITDAVLQPGFGGSVVVRDERVFTPEDYPKGKVEISIKPDAEQVTASACLTNQAPVQINKLSLSYRLEDRGDTPSEGLFSEKGAYAAFINENDEASLQCLSYNLQLEPQEWHFIAFPFNVDRNAFVSATENGSRQYVIRTYDSQARANQGMDVWPEDDNWKDVKGALQAGRGYILQTEYPEQSNDDYNLSVELTDAEAIQALLNTQAVSISLEEYNSTDENDKSWNLIGNPYPAFYNIRSIGFGNASIITIWNGQGYTPLSIFDDSYALRPLEAFFVQKPDDQSSITFNPQGRLPSASVPESYTFRSVSQPERRLLNLCLEGDTYIDRTRIVINPSARMDYDINNDAAKWMSPDKTLPQFYTLDEQGKQYAINERPAGTGCIPVGIYIGQTGTYTFKMLPEGDWQNVYLIDKYENKQVDLCHTTYSFRADKGTTDDRFEIRLGEIPTSNTSIGIPSYSIRTEEHTLYIQTETDAFVSIHTATGVQTYSNRIKAGTISIPLEQGFYLVRINESTHKVIIH